MRSSLRAIVPFLVAGTALWSATATAIAATAAAVEEPTAAQETRRAEPAGKSGEAAATTIAWLDYETGLARAKQAGKPILVSFWADWCGYCCKMRSETYTDPKVAAEVMGHFVPVSVNTTTQQKLAADYFVRGLPTIWFLTSDAGKIAAQPGYVDAPMFLKMLRYIDTGSYEKMNFEAFLNAGS